MKKLLLLLSICIITLFFVGHVWARDGRGGPYARIFTNRNLPSDEQNTAPDTSDDAGKGYKTGDIRLDEATAKVYFCFGGGTWGEASGGGGSGVSLWADSGATLSGASNFGLTAGTNITLTQANSGGGTFGLIITGTATAIGASGLTTVQTDDGSNAVSTSLGDAVGGMFLIGASGTSTTATGNTVYIGPDITNLEPLINVENLTSGTSKVFDKVTDTLDNVPNGTTYKLLTSAKEGYIDQSVVSGANPTFGNSGATPWESGGNTVFANSGNIQFVEGTNITLAVADDGEGASVTINSSGGSTDTLDGGVSKTVTIPSGTSLYVEGTSGATFEGRIDANSGISTASLHSQTTIKQYAGAEPAWGHSPTGGAFKGTMEFDGSVFFDDTANIYSTFNVMAPGELKMQSAGGDIYGTMVGGADDGLRIGAGYDGVGNANIIITHYFNDGIDHDCDIDSINPKVWLFSALSPNTDNTQWGSLARDSEAFVIDVGHITGSATGYPVIKVGGNTRFAIAPEILSIDTTSIVNVSTAVSSYVNMPIAADPAMITGVSVWICGVSGNTENITAEITFHRKDDMDGSWKWKTITDTLVCTGVSNANGAIVTSGTTIPLFNNSGFVEGDVIAIGVDNPQSYELQTITAAVGNIDTGAGGVTVSPLHQGYAAGRIVSKVIRYTDVWINRDLDGTGELHMSIELLSTPNSGVTVYAQVEKL